MSIQEFIQSAGVIGAGGAGFPTHVKLNTQAEYILLNGAECEPLLRVDQQLMKTHPAEVIGGLLLAAEAVGASHAVIGVKVSHPDVIDVLRETIQKMGEAAAAAGCTLSVGELPDVYPAGDEQVLVYELTGRIVPETGLPSAVGCVVMNSETAYNVFQASRGIPVTEKYVTVTGDVPNPVTLRVPVGTPVAALLEAAGLDAETASVLASCDPDVPQNTTGLSIVNGGPMMGGLLKPGTNPVDAHVTKKTKGLIVLPMEHPLVTKKRKPMEAAGRLNRSACEQCSMCTDLCPRHLLGHSTVPHKMVRAMAFGLAVSSEITEPFGRGMTTSTGRTPGSAAATADLTTLNLTAAQTCCQCNLCDYYSCPAGINPRMANLYYMTQLHAAGVKHTPKPAFTPDPLRPYRQIPSGRLIARLGLKPYNRPAPLAEPETGSTTGAGAGTTAGTACFYPATVAVSLADHVGTPALPAVSAGDPVSAGQLLAAPLPGALGATVHASITGVVTAVDEHLIHIQRT